MAQDIVVSMDDDLKSNFEEVCADIGLSAPSAILIFARRVVRERRIPFELRAAPLTDLFGEEPGTFASRHCAA